MQLDADKRQPGTGIRLFDIALRTLIVGLAVATLAGLVLAALFLTERGPIVVPSELEAPYAIRLSARPYNAGPAGLDEHERELVVGAPGAITGRINFDGEEAGYIKQAPTVHVNLRVDPGDTDTRVVVSAAGLVALVLGWLAALSLQGVVSSARSGDPFDPRNARRLRWVAASVLAVPVLGVVTSQALTTTLDSNPAVQPMGVGWAWLPFVVVGLGILALAEVFNEGSSLRQFEQETI